MTAKMPTAENPNIEKTVHSRKVRRVFGLDLHSWEQLMLLSLGVAGLMALAVFITTASVVILQRRETVEAQNALEKYKLSVEGKVAEAKKEGIEAGKVAGGAVVRAAELAAEVEAAKAEIAIAQSNAAAATERAASANERAAALEKDAVEARLRLEEMRNEARGRLVTQPQWESLERSLKGHKLSVHLACFFADLESRMYALSISQALERAGVKDTKIGSITDSVLYGVKISGPPGQDLDKLKSAFVDAEIDFFEEPGPSLLVSVGNKPPTIKAIEMPLPDAILRRPANP